MNKFSEFVLEKNGYAIHATFFEENYELKDDDVDYFELRATYWADCYNDYGYEPVFFPDNMKLAGVVRYGVITN